MSHRVRRRSATQLQCGCHVKHCDHGADAGWSVASGLLESAHAVRLQKQNYVEQPPAGGANHAAVPCCPPFPLSGGKKTGGVRSALGLSLRRTLHTDGFVRPAAGRSAGQVFPQQPQPQKEA
eukprot:scaffold12360_cov109-Isochrysis_galbana.AAC.9